MEFRVPPERRRGPSATATAVVALAQARMGRLAFLFAAIRDFHHVGTLWRTSRWAAREIARLLGPARRNVVEYGAGDGRVTAELLNIMPADGTLLALEINPEFCEALAEMGEETGDERLMVRRRDIVEFVQNGSRELPRIDAIVSGIPLSFHSAEERAMIVARTRELLAPGGLFIVYQVSPVFFPAVKRTFPKAKLIVSPKNLPPYFIAVAEK